MPDIKKTKPIKEVIKGDKIKVDGKEYEVDAHYILIENKDNKGNPVNEMAIELFNPDNEEDIAQIRYFSDRLEFMEFYELQGGLMFVKPRKEPQNIEW